MTGGNKLGNHDHHDHHDQHDHYDYHNHDHYDEAIPGMEWAPRAIENIS